MVTRGAMVSSSTYVVRVMVVDDIAVVENSGTPRFSHSTRNSSSGVMPLVTMKQEMSSPETSRMRFSRRRGKALQVLRLRCADDLHAPRLDVLVVAGEREPRLLHARTGDDPVQAVVAGDEFQLQVVQLAGPQRSDGGFDEVFVAHGLPCYALRPRAAKSQIRIPARSGRGCCRGACRSPRPCRYLCRGRR